MRAARFACSDLAARVRFRAALLACLDSARCEAADRVSFFSFANDAWARLEDFAVESLERLRLRSRLACLRTLALA